MAVAAVTAPRNEALPWAISASVILHMLLAAMLAMLPASMRPRRPQEEPVSVEILSPRLLQTAIAPLPAPDATTAPLAALPAGLGVAPQPQPAPAKPSAMIRATEMLSQKALADPRSRQVRADLATFASDERMSQLCDIEAMDQIHKWRADFEPDRVVSYATAEEKITGMTVRADGAAFRSRKAWYGLKFDCALAQDGASVIGFEFLVGDPVPRQKWDELGLPAAH